MKRYIMTLGIAVIMMTGLSSCGTFWATTVGPDLYLDDTYGPGYYPAGPSYVINTPPPGPGGYYQPGPPPGPQPGHGPGYGPGKPGQPGNPPGPGNGRPGPGSGNGHGPGNMAPSQPGNQPANQPNVSPGTPEQGGFRGQAGSGATSRH